MFAAFSSNIPVNTLAVLNVTVPRTESKIYCIKGHWKWSNPGFSDRVFILSCQYIIIISVEFENKNNYFTIQLLLLKWYFLV